ncbi:MAG: NlpC/P60 family protein [Actinomycetes bacterium]
MFPRDSYSVLPTARRLTLSASLVLTAALIASSWSPVQAASTSVDRASSVRVVSVAHPTAAHPTAVAPATAAKTTTAAVAAKAKAAKAKAAKMTKLRIRIVAIAKAHLGDRYRAGHTGPHSFDCSGLARYVVQKAIGRSLPHSSRAQFRVVAHISRSQLRAGDLVFFFRNGAHHVGIYIGGGRMVNATNPRGGVQVSSVFGAWFGRHYSGAGRVV